MTTISRSLKQYWQDTAKKRIINLERQTEGIIQESQDIFMTQNP